MVEGVEFFNVELVGTTAVVVLEAGGTLVRLNTIGVKVSATKKKATRIRIKPMSK
jgi:hypothetical protein